MRGDIKYDVIINKIVATIFVVGGEKRDGMVCYPKSPDESLFINGILQGLPTPMVSG